MVQQNGNGDNLKDGPKVSWLGYSFLSEGNPCLVPQGIRKETRYFTQNTFYLIVKGLNNAFLHICGYK